MRSLRVPLLNHDVVEDARRLAAFAPDARQREIAAKYAKLVRTDAFLNQKETSVRPLFIRDILEVLLGYRSQSADERQTLAYEYPARRGSVDVALGIFNVGDTHDVVHAPLELKGPGTEDLDRLMPGRGRSPVQQAWDYANDLSGSRWVLVSNCVELRLYGFGRGRDAYEIFDLSRLDEEEEHARLWLLLSSERLLGGHTATLLRDSDRAYRAITNELYVQYRDLRGRLIDYLIHSSEGPRLGLITAIVVAQKVLDRILFIAFAQRTDLLPDRLLEEAVKTQNNFLPQPIWKNFLALFGFIDRGYDRNEWSIPAYNGGLFARDEVADELILPDHLAGEVARLGEWDYRRKVPVTVLGHIFEQSITDIERLKAESRGEAPPEVSRRKKDGVVYTPDMVTRFLVAETVGRTLRDILAALGPADEDADEERERAMLQAYVERLRALRIVDPACGSGAFLVAAFDELAREYRSVTGRLADLGAPVDFDIFDEIVTRNLFGVDLNPESVEITRLSLWLKTARRRHKLQNLEATIRVGDSLVSDPAWTERPFDWASAFPQVFENGGFDVVIGNPPYVRMELIKAVKPHLEDIYSVAADRADLYAYFFEKGVGLLRPGGRLGYISSSTFFRTGSGENLRRFLKDETTIETVVDFGDLQVFEGVTTYPAIITLVKGRAEKPGSLNFLTVKDAVPDDLERLFEEKALPMPRARLTDGSWQFENDATAALRDRIMQGRRTLGEVCGPPLYGIKTGLNEAFIIDRATRDRLVKADPKSADLLKPFLKGENIKRWHVQSDDLYLINTPKGQVDIKRYPAIGNWLKPFRKELEKRATKQEWWELQQAQLAYQPKFAGSKIAYQDISASNPFCMDDKGYMLANTCYFISSNDYELLAYLNSEAAWFSLAALTNIARGGYLRLRSEFVERLAVPQFTGDARAELARLGQVCTEAAGRQHAVMSEVGHRILDLAPPDRRKLTGRLRNWHELSFPAFLAEVKQAFRAEIPLKQRGEWERFLSENRSEADALANRIGQSEVLINDIVNQMFGLTGDDIALLMASTRRER
jgi:hypothetical protein